MNMNNLRRYEAEIMSQNWLHSRDHHSDNEVHEEEAATGGGQQNNSSEGSENNQPGLRVLRFGTVRRKPQHSRDSALFVLPVR